MLYLKLTIAIFLLAAIIIGWQILVRQLSNLGLFWVRVPEMTALAVMKDRALDEILIVCSDAVWGEIKTCCEIKEEIYPRSTIGKIFGLRKPVHKGVRIIRLRKSLYYIGRPWVYKVYEWYFTQKEEEDIKVRPLHSLTLAVLNLVYEPQDIDPLTGVLNLMTADGIEVKAKLTFYGTIRNPEKSLFNIDYIKTYIRDLIIPKWRDTLGEFQFFEYQRLEEAEDTKAYLIATMDILNTKLRAALGIPKDGVAKVLYEEAGMVFKDITLGEFEPVVKEVRDALQQILIAKTEAQRAIQEAMGRKKARILDAEGDKQARILQGEGERGYLDKLAGDKQLLLSIRAIERATENLGKAQSLTLLNLQDIFGPLLRQLKQPFGNKFGGGKRS